MEMNKEYPYLLNSYYESKNEELSKKEFLSSLDDLVNQHQYVQITLLDWNENPIKHISGEITNGNLTKDGSSQIRRTCSLSCQISGGYYDTEDMKMDFSINKKIFLEFGIRNDTEKFKEFPILWFPQGVFFISDFSINSSSSSAVGISLTLKDKMGMLDGTIGGIIPATTILDEMDTQIGSTITTKKVLIYDLITEVVNHFGKEDLDKIVIEDIPLKIKRAIRWLGEGKCYIWQEANDDDSKWAWRFCTDEDKEYVTLPKDYEVYEYGEDIGYTYDDFVYDTELTVAAGSTVTSVLDTIKDYLGNFEYFYDEFGVFHFREIKNYLNNSLTSSVINDTEYANGLGDYAYMTDIAVKENVYSFNDKTNLISLTNTPQYGNIKNDFIVQGTRKAANGDISYDVRYHVAIDEKPEINSDGYDGILIYIDPDTGYKSLGFPEIIYPDKAQDLLQGDEFEQPVLPEYGDFNVIYGLLDEKKEFTFEKEIKDKNKIEDNYNDLQGFELKITNDNYQNILDFLNNYKQSFGEEEQSGIEAQIKYIKEHFKEEYKSDEELIINLSDFFGDTIKQYNNEILIEKINKIDKQIKIYQESFIPLAEKIVSNSSMLLSKAESNLIDALNKDYQDNFYMWLQDNNLNNIPQDYLNYIKYNGELNEDVAGEYLTNVSNDYKNRYNVYKANEDYLQSLKDILQMLIRKKSLLESLLYLNNEDTSTKPEFDIEEITYEALQTSFYIWTNEGWKELEWVSYHRKLTDSNYHSSYPFGIGSAVYFEYTEEMFQDSIKVSNNINSPWYKDNYLKYGLKNIEQGPYVAKEWRTEIILQGLQAEYYATDDKSYYFNELLAMWPTVYDFENQKFYGEEKDNPYWHKSLTDGNYYLDFIDPISSQVGEFCIDNIGRRTYVNISDDINCLFAPEIPDIVFIDIDNTTKEEIQEIKAILLDTNEKIVQVKNNTFSQMATGGMANGAYDQIKYDILTHTLYQKVISMTAIPAFYMEPNLRINIDDSSTGTHGNFIMTNISIPLGAGNQMSVSCSEVFEKI